MPDARTTGARGGVAPLRAAPPFACAAALALALGAAAPAAAAQPARNPYLADSANNQAHWNDAATDSTPARVARGHYCMSPGGAAIVPSDGLGIPSYSATVGGRHIVWFFSGAMLRKLEYAGGRFVEIDRQPIRQTLPGRTLLDDAARVAQADAIHGFLRAGDEAGLAAYLARQPNRLLSAVEDQVEQGVLYSLFTRDHGVIGANARGLVQFDNVDPRDPLSKLAPARHAAPEIKIDRRSRRKARRAGRRAGASRQKKGGERNDDPQRRPFHRR